MVGHLAVLEWKAKTCNIFSSPLMLVVVVLHAVLMEGKNSHHVGAVSLALHLRTAEGTGDPSQVSVFSKGGRNRAAAQSCSQLAH